MNLYFFVAPYGIRESLEQVKAKDRKKLTVPTKDAVHYPSTSSYSIKSMYSDLLEFSVKHLKLGGRLVFWFPVAREEYSDDMLPMHTALELVANSEQRLMGDTARRLLTYEKINNAGQLINVPDDIDFRTKYFNQGNGTRQERRTLLHQHNIIEAQKRGIVLENKTDLKKNSNKKRHTESEHNE